MSERKNILANSAELIADKAGRDMPNSKLKLARLSWMLNNQVVKNWLSEDSQIKSDTVISSVAQNLPFEVRDQQNVWELIKPKKTGEELYLDTLDRICSDVLRDLKENQGRLFRAIVSASRLSILDRIAGNEDLREGIETPVALERRVVKTAILYMTFKYIEMVDNILAKSQDKRNLN